MLALAGCLTTFSANIHPRDLPAYDHDDLGGCFSELDEKLRLLLETVVPTNFVSLPLKLVQPSIYATAIDRRQVPGQYQDVPGDQRRNQPGGDCRQDAVSGEGLLGQPHRAPGAQALPGVPLTYVAAPPSAIPVKLNYQYFSLSQSGLAWEAIQRARNLAAYVPGDLPNPQLELIILLPQALNA